MKKELEHQKDLFKNLIESENFQKEISTLKTIFEDSIWWASEEGKKLFLIANSKPGCPFYIKSRSEKEGCKRRLLSLLKNAKKAKRAVQFDCGSNKLGVCVPIIQGDKMYGYVTICHSRCEISDSVTTLFTNFIDTLIRELQNKSELAKLYKTIRPRAIALSTIHTIHRIISATLNLDELLPKLARLCLQIFRAEKCCILLKNQPKKPLIVVAATRNEKNRNTSLYGNRYIKIFNKERILTRGNIVMGRNKLCVPLTDEDIIGAICVMNKTNKTPFDEFDREILMTLSEQAAIAIKNAKLYKEQEDITIGSIKSLAAVLDTRTRGTYRVRESFIQIVLAIAKELHLNMEARRNLHYAAILHDAGQIAFPDKLLTKTDKLTGEEYSIIKRHPHKSVSIIKHLSFLKPVVPIILHHHENYDGSGYPKGLKGREIPLGARIMALATAFNAMITKRPYRQKVDIHSAIAEIKKNSSTQFDPLVVKAFLKVIQDNEIATLLERGL